MSPIDISHKHRNGNIVDISVKNSDRLRTVISFSGSPSVVSTSSGHIDRNVVISNYENIVVSVVAYGEFECICSTEYGASTSKKIPFKSCSIVRNDPATWRIRYIVDDDIVATVISRGSIDSLCFGYHSDMLLSSDICLYIKDQKKFILPLEIVQTKMSHLYKGTLLGFFELNKSETGLSKNTVRKTLVSNTIKLSDFPNIPGAINANMLLRSI